MIEKINWNKQIEGVIGQFKTIIFLLLFTPPKKNRNHSKYSVFSYHHDLVAPELFRNLTV